MTVGWKWLKFCSTTSNLLMVRNVNVHSVLRPLLIVICYPTATGCGFDVKPDAVYHFEISSKAKERLGLGDTSLEDYLERFQQGRRSLRKLMITH